MTYYRRIQKLRSESGRTQEEVSDYLKIKVQVYNKYELGNIDIPFSSVIMLAKYYNTSLDYIAGLKNDNCILPTELCEFIDFFVTCSFEEKRKITGILRIIMKNIK